MRSIISPIILCLAALSTLINLSSAAPQLLASIGASIGELLSLVPILSTPPPQALMTKQPSPECANVNNGALLCCQSTFNGDIPIVVELAATVAYKLNPNSINCIYGQRNFTDCSRGTELCCQVDALATTPLSDIVSLALYCNTPSQTESSAWSTSI